jgi:hypothetical protein
MTKTPEQWAAELPWRAKSASTECDAQIIRTPRHRFALGRCRPSGEVLGQMATVSDESRPWEKSYEGS